MMGDKCSSVYFTVVYNVNVYFLGETFPVAVSFLYLLLVSAATRYQRRHSFSFLLCLSTFKFPPFIGTV